VSHRRHPSTSAPFSLHFRVTLGLRLMGVYMSSRLVVDPSMQSTRPGHHANTTRSLFKNQWTLEEPTPSTTPSTSTYWPAFPAALSTFPSIPNISLERVRNSELHPHPPIKVVKPDWGHSTLTASSEPNVKATWLGHAVCCS
jgi:hypothetical protein